MAMHIKTHILSYTVVLSPIVLVLYGTSVDNTLAFDCSAILVIKMLETSSEPQQTPIISQKRIWKSILS